MREEDIHIFYFYADSYYLPVFLTYNLCEKYSLYFFFKIAMVRFLKITAKIASVSWPG